MTRERKEEILKSLAEWISLHGNEFIECAMDYAGISEKEADELGIIDFEQRRIEEEENNG